MPIFFSNYRVAKSLLRIIEVGITERLLYNCFKIKRGKEKFEKMREKPLFWQFSRYVSIKFEICEMFRTFFWERGSSLYLACSQHWLLVLSCNLDNLIMLTFYVFWSSSRPNVLNVLKKNLCLHLPAISWHRQSVWIESSIMRLNGTTT